MITEFVISLIFAVFSLTINIYQSHREDKIKGKIKSWLEISRGIHSVSQCKGTEEISRFTNSLIVDLEYELNSGKLWNRLSLILFLLASGVLIGMLIFNK